MSFEQINLFEGTTPRYKITKPVRLIELFAGIGSQHQALKKLGVTIDRSTIVEWQHNSIQAYNDIHIRKYDDHTQGMSKEEVAQKIASYGVSINYNNPAPLESLLRKSDEWLRNVYNNIINTNNKVNIMSVKAKDLEIKDTNKYDYIMTYSYPCQDLSIAGLRKGMSDTKTRSGLLWEVERILDECKEDGNLPQILLMENVPDVISSKFIKDFQKWELKLQQLGYSNYCEILNATDYGIPQNRRRAFMVSILGNYLYSYPRPFKLNKKLKDLLETNVEEKYYLSKEKIEQISKWNAQQDPLKDIDKEKILSPTLTARGAGEDHSGMVLINESLFTETQAKMITPDGNIKRYLGSEIVDVFEEGDGANISYPNGYGRGNRVQKGITPTLTCTAATELIVKVGNYMESGHNASSIVSPNGVAPTVMENHGTVTAILEQDEVDGFIKNINQNAKHQQDLIQDSETTCRTIPAGVHGSTPHLLKTITNINPLRIRKLTPKECYRLMGFDDNAYNLAAPNQTATSLYHQAGDSIVVDVLENILKELL